jgi:predicted metalloprotease
VLCVAAGGLAAVVGYGLKGSGDAKLPIINGPQTGGEWRARDSGSSSSATNLS